MSHNPLVMGRNPVKLHVQTLSTHVGSTYCFHSVRNYSYEYMSCQSATATREHPWMLRVSTFHCNGNERWSHRAGGVEGAQGFKRCRAVGLACIACTGFPYTIMTFVLKDVTGFFQTSLKTHTFVWLWCQCLLHLNSFKLFTFKLLNSECSTMV